MIPRLFGKHIWNSLKKHPNFIALNLGSPLVKLWPSLRHYRPRKVRSKNSRWRGLCWWLEKNQTRHLLLLLQLVQLSTRQHSWAQVLSLSVCKMHQRYQVHHRPSTAAEVLIARCIIRPTQHLLLSDSHQLTNFFCFSCCPETFEQILSFVFKPLSQT